MDEQALKDIKRLIGFANTKQAIEKLQQLVENNATLADELHMIEARLNQVETQDRIGILTTAEKNIINNQINNSLLQLVNKVADQHNDIPSPQPARTPSSIKTKILFLSANPNNLQTLDLALEKREVEEELERSQERDRFILVKQDAVRVNELMNGLLKHRPQIIHFSGHADENGVYLLNDQGASQCVPFAGLADLFHQFSDNLACVILNACLSAVPAELIAQHIGYVIAMGNKITDPAALQFSKNFYKALGAGESIPKSFCLARTSLALLGMSEEAKPVLWVRHQAKNGVLKPIVTAQVVDKSVKVEQYKC